jgi:hypothetical protein
MRRSRSFLRRSTVPGVVEIEARPREAAAAGPVFEHRTVLVWIESCIDERMGTSAGAACDGAVPADAGDDEDPGRGTAMPDATRRHFV